MKKKLKTTLLTTGLFVMLNSGCASPKLNLKPTHGPDHTGAMKYQLWTAYIHVAPVAIKESKPPDFIQEFGLKGAVLRNPYKPVILMAEKDTFFDSTKINYTPIKNTMMPEKLTVAVEDKTEKRIEQAGSLIKAALPLLFMEVPSTSDKRKKEGRDEFQEAIASFEPWTINLMPAIESGKLTDKRVELSEKDGIGENPKGWKYTLDIQPKSSTSIDIHILDDTKLAEFLESIGKQGLIIYPSCRTAILNMTHDHTKKQWTSSFQIPDPCWVETIKLPYKGAVIFNECSVAVEPGDRDNKDYIDYMIKLAETAAGVWEQQKKNAESQE